MTNLIDGIKAVLADQWNQVAQTDEENNVSYVPRYSFQFEDQKMMNVTADNQPFPCVFFEEYTNGSYNVKFGINKKTIVQLYFMRLQKDVSTNAIDREALRNQIESEAVLPFIRSIGTLRPFREEMTEFKFFTPPPRFDANEVSIMLQFECKYPV